MHGMSLIPMGMDASALEDSASHKEGPSPCRRGMAMLRFSATQDEKLDNGGRDATRQLTR